MCVEIITVSVGIVNHMSTEKISLMIVSIGAIWMMFMIASVWINNLVKE